MRITLLVFFLFLNVFCAVSQKIIKPLLKISGDCSDAIPLTIILPSKYGPTDAPKSFGAVKEISTKDKNSELSFTEEHNSAWYLLSIKYDGDLTFEIIPTDSTDDYDFLLYPYGDSMFCGTLMNKAIKPLRSNIAANMNYGNKGATGLSASAKQDFHKQGPGDPFSRSIMVKKGEKYMLVLDNVTPNGKGHTIYFHPFVKIEIKGVVVGADSLPLIAEVLLADPQGKTVAQTTTDAAGKYELKTEIERNTPHSLIFSNDSSFIGTKIINTSDTRDGHSFPNIKAVLPKLRKGEKYQLGNINFYGNSAEFLPESYPSVEALTRLMKKNKKMTIEIEGHVNGVGSDALFNGFSFINQTNKKMELNSPEFQELSENRAEMMRNCLLAAGISGDRMKTIGYAATRMLFPHAKDEEEQKANRRVEIKVISINGE